MTLIKSISGIRGTIGGKFGENLTPLDLTIFLSAYAMRLKEKFPKNNNLSVVLGRDGRISGQLIHQLTNSVLRFNGISVLDLNLATTPTVEMSVIQNKAQGGIILSASHNPEQWNALKLLDEKGEFLSADEGNIIFQAKFTVQPTDDLEQISKNISKLEMQYYPIAIARILQV